MTKELSFPVKQQIKVTGIFKNEAGALTDTTVVCKVRSPAGAEVTHKVEAGHVLHPGTGEYTLLITLEEEGPYTVRWEGSGALVAASEETILAQVTEFY